MIRAFNRQIPLVIMLLFVIGALSTLFLLFGLTNDLALQAGVLSSTELDRAKPFVLRLKLVMGITLAAGFAGLLYFSRQRQVQEVYVERMKQQEKTTEAEKQAEIDKLQEEAWVDDLLVPSTSKEELLKNVFERICSKTEAVAGGYYALENGKLELTHQYALAFGESQRPAYELGEGLIGQAAKSQKQMILHDVPENSLRAVSGLGESGPKHLMIIPIVVNEKTHGVTEIGTFSKPSKHMVRTLEESCRKIGSFLSDDTVVKKTRKDEATTEENKSTRKKS
jgi:putative methionine-R-sulfoxide reductase with GAF domain